MCVGIQLMLQKFGRKKNTQNTFTGGILAGADVTDDTFLEIK